MRKLAMASMLLLFSCSCVKAQLPKAPEPHTARKAIMLDVLSAGASLADEISTEHFRARGVAESDPLARPFTEAPATVYFAIGATMDLGLAYIVHQMRRSHHDWERQMWWVPQAAQIGAQCVLATRNFGLGYRAKPRPIAQPPIMGH